MAQIGEQLGHYRLVSKIGAGGMGEVYLAEDTKLGRKVGIKFLKDEFSRDAVKLSRFVREAKAASALNHPNILTVYEIGEIENTNYLVTEFIEGSTLRSLLVHQETLPLLNILKITIEVCEALAAAHRAGIVHRDIKPENIMIRTDGYAKVLDFGLAKLTETKSSTEEEKTLTVTIPGMILGTACYMSPEQARGKTTDARTDIWSLGIVLYEMLTGGVPFAGETVNHTIVSILEKEPPQLENAPAELQRIVRKTLTKDKEMRYQTAQDLLIDLKNLRRTLDIQDELDRSYGGNSHSQDYKPKTNSLQETATRAYLRDQNEKTIVEEAARPTVRTIDIVGAGGVSSSWKTAFFLFPILALLALAAWWYNGGRTKEATTGAGLMKSVGITSWSIGPNELSIEAAFSTNAQMIAYSSWRSGTSEIWIKPTVGGDSIQVTKNGFNNKYPAWSPNGQELAFVSNRAGKSGIWRTSFTGGEQTKITGDINGEAIFLRYWAPGGKIYFQNNSELFSVDEKSGETKRLTDFQAQKLQPRVIEISPDESKIAFSIKENDLFKIKVKGLDAEQSVEIATSKDQLDFMAWHPNGKDLIFSATVDGTFQIFKGSTSGETPIQLSTGDSDSFVEDVSDDGNRILYWSQNESSDLWMVNIQDGHEALLADSMASEYWAAVSPDGKSVAYQSVTRANRPFSGSINVKPISGKGAAPLTVSVNGFSPVWSKNNSWIAYFRRTEKDVELWRVETSGGDARKLASGAQPPSYTAVPYLKIGINQLASPPNSDAVAYVAKRDGKSNIWLVTPDGQRDELLTRNEDPAEILCCPAWTPDGKYFVVSSSYISPDRAVRPNINRLWLYTADTSEKKMIYESTEKFRFLGIGNGGKDAVIAIFPDVNVSTPTRESIHINLVSLETGANVRVNTLSNAYVHNIHLSPDGKMITFVTRRENVSEVWVVPASSGGAPRKIIAENNPKVFISSLSWSPDGKSIVFGRQSQNSLLSMLIK
jgi:serine/threonine protein kinase